MKGQEKAETGERNKRFYTLSSCSILTHVAYYGRKISKFINYVLTETRPRINGGK